MTGGGRGGRSRGRGGRGRGGNGNGQQGPGQPSPVEFHLYASEHFDMTGCPALVRQATVPDARARLSMPDRGVLGDIVLWFAASAVAEPTATLVMWQATKQDKTWLSGYVEQSVPQLEVGVLEVHASQKYTQFKLRSGLVPMPAAAAVPEPAAEQEAAPVAPPAPAAAASNGKPADDASSTGGEAAAAAIAAAAPAKGAAEAVQQAAKDVSAKLASAGKAAQTAVVNAEQHAAKAVSSAAAAAGEAAKETAEAVGAKASSAAAAVKEGLSEARQQIKGGSNTASDKARTWFDAVQTDGANPQMLAIAGAATAAVLTVVGVTLTVLFGRKRK